MHVYIYIYVYICIDIYIYVYIYAYEFVCRAFTDDDMRCQEEKVRFQDNNLHTFPLNTLQHQCAGALYRVSKTYRSFLAKEPLIIGLFCGK